jgi:SNF2 family DNA or RNA helicase
MTCCKCYESYYYEDKKNCAVCRKEVRLAETRIVDFKKREDSSAADQRRKQAEEQLEKVAQELKTTHGRLSASTWRNLYERFPRPVDADESADASLPALPGDFLAHLKRATSIPIVSNKSAAVLVENSSQYSSKIRALLKDLPTDERSVVFASSKDIIMLLHKVFDIERIQYRALYTGQASKESGRAISEWQTIDSCRVLLVQAGAAACGLTLTAARKMFIVDPFQRHEEEKQAYARIHRIGQTQKVEIKVYYSPVSVESRLLDWRNRARSRNPDAETITNVIHGTPMEEDDDDDDVDDVDDDVDDDVREDDQVEFLLGRDLIDVDKEEIDATFSV